MSAARFDTNAQLIERKEIVDHLVSSQNEIDRMGENYVATSTLLEEQRMRLLGTVDGPAVAEELQMLRQDKRKPDEKMGTLIFKLGSACPVTLEGYKKYEVYAAAICREETPSPLDVKDAPNAIKGATLTNNRSGESRGDSNNEFYIRIPFCSAVRYLLGLTPVNTNDDPLPRIHAVFKLALECAAQSLNAEKISAEAAMRTQGGYPISQRAKKRRTRVLLPRSSKQTDEGPRPSRPTNGFGIFNKGHHTTYLSKLLTLTGSFATELELFHISERKHYLELQHERKKEAYNAESKEMALRAGEEREQLDDSASKLTESLHKRNDRMMKRINDYSSPGCNNILQLISKSETERKRTDYR